MRRYAHPSRLFFFSLHLYDKEDPHQTQSGGQTAVSESASVVPIKANPDRPIDAVTALAEEEEDSSSTTAVAAATGSATPQRRYEFYPGTGVKDDHVRLTSCTTHRISSRGILTFFPLFSCRFTT